MLRSGPQDSPGIADEPNFDDMFGGAVAAGDFNADGFDDLAIGAEGESLISDPDQLTSMGVVHILYGSATGLTSNSSQYFTEDLIGLDAAEFGDQFGGTLEAGNFGNDQPGGCYDDLVIAARGEVVNGQDAAGTVQVLYGSAIGLSTVGAQLWSVDSPGIVGTPGREDNFGWTLAAGSFHQTESVCGSHLQDLAIGAPLKEVSGQFGAGAVYVLYATNSGLSSAGSQRLHQNSTNVANIAEADDHFGLSLGTGQSASGADFLLIGVPAEDLSPFPNPFEANGAAHVLFTDASGFLTGTGSKFYHQNTPGIQDAPEHSDFFGFFVVEETLWSWFG